MLAPHRLPRAAVTTTLIVVALLSCDRAADRAGNDSSGPGAAPRTDTTVTTPTFSDWRASAGRHLIVTAGSPDTAVVVFPEFTQDSSLDNVHFILNSAPDTYELFGSDGTVTTARLTKIESGTSACAGWPIARVEPVGELRTWTVGLQTGRAHAIPYVPIDRLSARDSSAIVVAIARLASQAPNDTVSALQGLPYVVRSAYTALLPDSQAFVFGEVVRRVNIEASPHEERTVVMGEHAKSEATTGYRLVFSERHTGDEESIPTTELLGLVQLRDGMIAAVVARDYSDGGTYLMLERDGSRRWRVRWQSAYAGC